ncbi:MazG-like family protein [Kitasatospora sp. SUK 42]|uniref:MazG-like family protein n=1 Tax=Kitasatospora sp. SUK 42 TaxID=1588882 RepID=UPI0020C83523|nr:MazG-like family protein [Kitasatospora sp. SUK 42]
MDGRIWESVDHLVAWLDEQSTQEERLLRILKVSEEVGEVGAAVIGATGQNPRKGVTHTWEDVQHELCDVVFAALVALRTLTPDAARVFAERLAYVEQRSAASRDTLVREAAPEVAPVTAARATPEAAPAPDPR